MADKSRPSYIHRMDSSGGKIVRPISSNEAKTPVKGSNSIEKLTSPNSKVNKSPEKVFQSAEKDNTSKSFANNSPQVLGKGTGSLVLETKNNNASPNNHNDFRRRNTTEITQKLEGSRKIKEANEIEEISKRYRNTEMPNLEKFQKGITDLNVKNNGSPQSILTFDTNGDQSNQVTIKSVPNNIILQTSPPKASFRRTRSSIGQDPQESPNSSPEGRNTSGDITSFVSLKNKLENLISEAEKNPGIAEVKGEIEKLKTDIRTDTEKKLDEKIEPLYRWSEKVSQSIQSQSDYDSKLQELEGKFDNYMSYLRNMEHKVDEYSQKYNSIGQMTFGTSSSPDKSKYISEQNDSSEKKIENIEQAIELIQAKMLEKIKEVVQSQVAQIDTRNIQTLSSEIQNLNYRLSALEEKYEHSSSITTASIDEITNQLSSNKSEFQKFSQEINLKLSETFSKIQYSSQNSQNEFKTQIKAIESTINALSERIQEVSIQSSLLQQQIILNQEEIKRQEELKMKQEPSRQEVNETSLSIKTKKSNILEEQFLNDSKIPTPKTEPFFKRDETKNPEDSRIADLINDEDDAMAIRPHQTPKGFKKPSIKLVKNKLWSLEHYNLLQNVLSKKFRIEECNKDDFDISKFLIIPIKDSSGIKFKHPYRLYISVNKLSLNSTFNSEDNSYAVGGKIGLTEFSFSELVKLIHEKIDSEIKSKKKVVLFYDQDTQKFKDWLDNIDEIDLNAFQFEHIEFTDSKVTQPYICDKVLLIFNHLGKIDTDRFKRALTLKDKYKEKFKMIVLKPKDMILPNLDLLHYDQLATVEYGKDDNSIIIPEQNKKAMENSIEDFLNRS